MCLRISGLLVGLALGITATAGEILAPLLRVDGSRSDARCLGVDAGQVVLADANGSGRLAWNELVVWGHRPESDRGYQVLLRDGSLLVGELRSISLEHFVLQSRAFGELTLPRVSVAGVIVRPPPDTLERDLLRHRILGMPRETEQILLLNHDELEGIAVSAGPGDLLSSLRIEPSNTVTPIEHVQAIACRSALGAGLPTSPALTAGLPTSQTLWIGWRDGSQIAVNQVDKSPAGITLTTSGGVSVAVRDQEPWNDVCWLQSVPLPNGNWVFLSDLSSTGFKYIPWISGEWELGLDRNVLGGSLRSAGQVYSKGLGMHSAARSAYDLGRRFRWLEAELAIDDRASGRGAALFRVYLDRVPPGEPAQWELAFESPLIRGSQPPVPMRVNVAGAERLALVVDFGERGDECDYANWLLARLIR
jgi:hypothetical protein